MLETMLRRAGSAHTARGGNVLTRSEWAPHPAQHRCQQSPRTARPSPRAAAVRAAAAAARRHVGYPAVLGRVSPLAPHTGNMCTRGRPGRPGPAQHSLLHTTRPHRRRSNRLQVLAFVLGRALSGMSGSRFGCRPGSGSGLVWSGGLRSRVFWCVRCGLAGVAVARSYVLFPWCVFSRCCGICGRAMLFVVLAVLRFFGMRSCGVAVARCSLPFPRHAFLRGSTLARRGDTQHRASQQ